MTDWRNQETSNQDFFDKNVCLCGMVFFIAYVSYSQFCLTRRGKGNRLQQICRNLPS